MNAFTHVSKKFGAFLKMEAAVFSMKLATVCRTTGCYHPKQLNLQSLENSNLLNFTNS